MTYAAAKHGAIRKTPLKGWRRFDKHAGGGAACLLVSRMPHQEKRPPRRLCPQTEPAAFRQAERFGIATNLQNSRDKGSARQSGFGQPQGLIQPAWRGIKELMGIDTELTKPSGMKRTGLMAAECIGNPEHGTTGSVFFDLHLRGKRQGKPAGCSRIMEGKRTDLGDGIKKQASIQCLIQQRNVEWQPDTPILGIAVGQTRRQLRLFLGSSCRQGPAFHFGDLLTQGKNRLLRRSFMGHGVSSI